MKLFMVVLLFLPLIALSDETSKGVFDEFQLSISHIGVNYSKLDKEANSSYIRGGLSASLFKKLNDKLKVFGGASLSGFRGGSDDFKQREKGIDIFLGLRNILSQQFIVFVDFELSVGYSERKYERLSGVFSDKDKSKSLAASVYIGKSIPINDKHAIEGKFGALVNYLNNTNGWSGNVFAPTSTLSWSYKLD